MQFDNTQALDASDALPVRPVAPRSDRSAWGAPWRAVKAGAADVLGSTADVLKGFGAASAMTLEADPVARSVLGTKAVEQGAAVGRKQIASGDSLSSAVGDSFRQVSRDMRPDPATASMAEEIVFGAVRPITKLVGAGLALGPIGLGLASLEEGFTQADDLRLKGVDPLTRTQVGALAAGATAAGAFLPLAGSTIKATAGLYLAGGPGAYMAQQAATRSILERANYAELGKQYDPFDPLGLTLSALIPLPFAAFGAARNVRAMRAEKGAPVDTSAGPVQKPAESVQVEPEVVDAAMAHNLTMLNDVHEVTPQAAAVAQMMRGPVTENPSFKAWHEGSKAVDEQGAPLVVYHGTANDFDSFSIERAGSANDVGKLGQGFYFSQDPRWSSNYAANAAARAQSAPAVMPVYLQLRNPVLLSGKGDVWSKLRAVGQEWGIDASPVIGENMAPNPEWARAFSAEAQSRGFDGVVLPSVAGQTEYMVFRPEQIKSAIGNSGRFNQNSGSLTDPLPTPVADAASTGPDFGRLASAVESARGLIDEAQAQGKSLDMLLTERKVLDDVNNVVIGLREAAQDPRRMNALVQRLVQEARDQTKHAADATADAVQSMLDLTEQQLKDIAQPVKASGDAVTQQVASRVETMLIEKPDLVTRVTEDGQQVRASEELDAARKVAFEGADSELGAADADLLRVAAECALSLGTN